MLILSTSGLERVMTKMQEVGEENIVPNTMLPRPGLGQQASSVRVGLLSGKEFPVRMRDPANLAVLMLQKRLT